MLRSMGVRADRDDLTAKLTVAREDLLTGFGCPSPYLKPPVLISMPFPLSIRSLRISSITSLYLA